MGCFNLLVFFWILIDGAVIGGVNLKKGSWGALIMANVSFL